MMKDRVFGHGTTSSMVGSPISSKVAKSKREEKEKENKKAKVDSKALVEHTLVKNKLKTLGGGQKMIVFGGPREKEARKGSSKGKNYSLRMMSVPIIQRKLQVMSNPRTKEEARIRKEKGKEGACLQSELSASETPSEEGYGHFWESDDWYSSFTDHSSNSATRGITAWYGTGHTAWMAAVPLDLANHPTHDVLDLGCTRLIGSRAAITRFQKHALYYGIKTEFCRCKNPVVCANSETESCWESCIIHFPTTPPCSTGVDVLETGNVPIILSLPQM